MGGSHQGLCRVFSSEKGVGTDFLAQLTLLHVCHHVAAVLVKGTTMSAWLGVWECAGKERMNEREATRGVGNVL